MIRLSRVSLDDVSSHLVGVAHGSALRSVQLSAYLDSAVSVTDHIRHSSSALVVVHSNRERFVTLS